MKKNIIISLAIFCLLLFFLMIKYPNKKVAYQDSRHIELDSAMLYASYQTTDAGKNNCKIAFPPSFLTAYLQDNKVTNDSILLGYCCEQSDTIGFSDYYRSLPTNIKDLLDQNLIGIYFFENLSLDGFLHTVYGVEKVEF